jgi:ribokinase
VDESVVVVGSVNVDLIVEVPRLPAVGETVIGGRFHRAPGGKGANQAVAASRLGARTWFVGLVGDDDLGQEARRDLEEAGVDATHLGTGSGHTGVAGILVGEGGENVIAVASGANSEVSTDHVRASLEAVGAGSAVVLSVLEIPDEAVMAAAEGAKRRGWRFVLNPAPARALPPELVALCDVLVPNETEAGNLGFPTVGALLEAGAGAVVVTRGPAGADVYRPDRPVEHQPAAEVDAVDTTGAGDAFTAALAWALSGGRDLEEAVRLAAAAGALACREVGARASLPTEDEVERFAAGSLAGDPSPTPGPVSGLPG